MKITGTNNAIIKEANKFSKISFKKSSSRSSIYKTSSPAGIENEGEFFWHQNESIYSSQSLPKLLNSKQLYCETKLPHVTKIPIKFSTVSL